MQASREGRRSVRSVRGQGAPTPWWGERGSREVSGGIFREPHTVSWWEEWLGTWICFPITRLLCGLPEHEITRLTGKNDLGLQSRSWETSL